MDLVPFAVPLFLLAIVLELAYGRWRGNNTYRINDSIGSLFMGSLSTASKLVVFGVGGLVFAAIEQHYALWRMDTSSAFTWVFAFVGYDLCYYWFHRISHERQFLWAAHVAHHQSEEYNLTTALRQTSTGFLLGWVFYVPLFLLGVPAVVVVTVGSINLIYQFWVHTRHVGKLGWYENLFVTPSNHRVHHAQNDVYVDRNYGGVFIIWDRMFGSFQEELENEPCIYGIRGPLQTFSPLWANLHIYVGMIQDAWRARSWKDKLHVLVARTGWRPADVAQRYPRAKTDLDHFAKFDPAVPGLVSVYALLQLGVVLVVGVGLLVQPAAHYFDNLSLVGMLLFTMVCTGGWLDGRKLVALEVLRLLGLSVLGWSAWQDGASAYLVVLLALYVLGNSLVLPLLRRAEAPMPEANIIPA